MPRFMSEADALLALSEGLQSASRAPNIKKYTPHTKQHQFHSSRKKKKLYIGGNRSGKTTGGVCEDIWRATCRHPYRPDLNAIGPNRGRVISVSLTDGVEGIIFPQFKQWLYPSAIRGGSWEDAYDKTLRVLNFSNGSTIEFKSYDQDLEKHAGTSRHWIHFDEEPPKSIYGENLARLVDTDGDFYITMTPVEGMTWVYDDLYENNVDNPDGDVEVVEVDMYENPFLSEGAIRSFLGSLDEDEREARKAGKFVQQGGRIFKAFDRTKGGIYVPNEPVEHPKQRFKDWLWICGLDHGLKNPTAVLWVAVSPKGEVHVFREHYKPDWSIEQHAARIHAINKEHGRIPDLYVADPSIQNRNAVTMTSIHEEYMKYGIPFTLGNNDVKAGIIRMKKYFDPRRGLGGKPLIQIYPNCDNLIWELNRYRWKTYANRKLQYENNSFEEPHKKDDHACDSLRYIIMTRPDLIAEPNSLEDKVNTILSGINFGGTSADVDRADPWAVQDNPNWSEFNSLPNHMTEWETDEHMGGIL